MVYYKIRLGFSLSNLEILKLILTRLKTIITIKIQTFRLRTGPAIRYNFSNVMTHGALFNLFHGIDNCTLPMKPYRQKKITLIEKYDF